MFLLVTHALLVMLVGDNKTFDSMKTIRYMSSIGEKSLRVYFFVWGSCALVVSCRRVGTHVDPPFTSLMLAGNQGRVSHYFMQRWLMFNLCCCLPWVQLNTETTRWLSWYAPLCMHTTEASRCNCDCFFSLSVGGSRC